MTVQHRLFRATFIGRTGTEETETPSSPFHLCIASIAVIVAGVRVVVRQCGILCDQMQWPGPYTLPVLLVS